MPAWLHIIHSHWLDNFWGGSICRVTDGVKMGNREHDLHLFIKLQWQVKLPLEMYGHNPTKVHMCNRKIIVIVELTRDVYLFFHEWLKWVTSLCFPFLGLHYLLPVFLYTLNMFNFSNTSSGYIRQPLWHSYHLRLNRQLFITSAISIHMPDFHGGIFVRDHYIDNLSQLIVQPPVHLGPKPPT